MGRRSTVSFLFVALVGVFCLGIGYLLFNDMTAPKITLTPRQELISLTLPLTVTATDEKSAIKKISIIARHSGRVIPIVEKVFPTKEKSQSITFTLQETSIKDAGFDLEVTATDDAIGGFGRGNSKTETLAMRIDTTPPRITVKTTMPTVRRGGTGVVLYSVSKDVTQTGIKVGSFFFPAFRQANNDYLCFFAFPYFMDVRDYSPQIFAADTAGNTQTSPLAINRATKVFRQDVITLTPNFIESKVEEFSRIVPGEMSDIDRFITVNSKVRRDNAKTLIEIGKETAQQMLWKEAFLRLPNSAARAGFADHRNYIWQGQKVDEQTHLGFDLASLAQAEIPAANSGTVVFADYLGIYGNLVVIDHGLGLQSLYSHLSRIGVQKGQTVQKGDIIGNTGTTGMAGGDHLHFGILIAGLEVTPLEWLDSHWIKDNVIDRIKTAGGVTPSFTPINDPSDTPASPPSPQNKGKTKPKKGKAPAKEAQPRKR